MKIAGHEIHPAASIFPLIKGPDFEAFVEDIRKHGQKSPAVFHPDGRLLDGRNRARACKRLGVELVYETWDGVGSVAEYIISANLHRRHLNESQRAMIAVDLLAYLRDEALERKAEGQKKGGLGKRGKKHKSLETKNIMLGARSGSKHSRAPRPPQSRDQAARLVGCSKSLVSYAKTIKENDPEAAERIRQGKERVATKWRTRPRIRGLRGKRFPTQHGGALEILRGMPDAIDGYCSALTTIKAHEISNSHKAIIVAEVMPVIAKSLRVFMFKVKRLHKEMEG